MNKSLKKILLVLFTVLCLGLILLAGVAALLGYVFFHVSHDDAIATVIDWGRFAPLPTSHTNLKIQSEGSMFTRGYHLSFNAPVKDILAWMKASPSLKDEKPPQSGVMHYELEPGGGAQWAEITIDLSTGKVMIYAYWS